MEKDRDPVRSGVSACILLREGARRRRRERERERESERERGGGENKEGSCGHASRRTADIPSTTLPPTTRIFMVTVGKEQEIQRNRRTLDIPAGTEGLRG